MQPESIGHATVRSDYRLGELHGTAQVCWRDADRLRILLRVKAASDESTDAVPSETPFRGGRTSVVALSGK